jgi:FkbM family methyltransferase
MGALMKLHLLRPLRAIVLPLLKLFNRDICIKHHWTGDRFFLNLFKHKGYWYHGVRRESKEMLAFEKILMVEDDVLEVGGHIGYLSMYFSHLVGAGGSVTVFEPGSNNLPYLRLNAASRGNIVIVEAACADQQGVLTIYEDTLSGQNNSLVPNFEGLQDNVRNAPGIKVDAVPRLVEVTRIDQNTVSRNPDFIKIDVEGFELSVLEGASGLVSPSSLPMFMVEVQQDHEAISQWFSSRGYLLYNQNHERIDSIPKGVSNVFALHPVAHKGRYNRWLGNLE